MADKTALSNTEHIAGENALKHYVLTGGWRNAHFIKEPDLPKSSIIDYYCDSLERIANFAKKWGTSFHRSHMTPSLSQHHCVLHDMDARHLDFNIDPEVGKDGCKPLDQEVE
ncbi:hypothetical protein TSTA_009020 [Talaromyces stipitatus ATCC 10500]|uniref:Uncharacterized protein n=1 Tax=Talaromyces stipitatus (strain ATCC 10500 / CBS 375.48 / QM 6759 / NRRL 1006) TaxID=441959 RepID=B8MF08_TALSN|nr:uncharacterized protein TSTA_009020 [Talaromyces stipitatus ATCC 10500]EED15777.1 hypothetical protein TSTA_009020 [Talaromyces stipitatus ATCC 10500]